MHKNDANSCGDCIETYKENTVTNSMKPQTQAAIYKGLGETCRDQSNLFTLRQGTRLLEENIQDYKCQT